MTGTTKYKNSIRGRLPDGKPNPVDVHVGKRIRLRRLSLGISQEVMAGCLGVTFQQVQKYERGANRIGASRLFDVACILKTDVSFFFREMDKEVVSQTPAALKGTNWPGVTKAIEDPFLKKENIRLVTSFNRIGDAKVKETIRQLVLLLG